MFDCLVGKLASNISHLKAHTHTRCLAEKQIKIHRFTNGGVIREQSEDTSRDSFKWRLEVEAP